MSKQRERVTEQKLKAAAVDGFFGSFKLAGALVRGIVRAPVAVLGAFVHSGQRPSRRRDDPHFSHTVN